MKNEQLEEKQTQPFLTKEFIDFKKLNILEEIFLHKLNRSENYEDLENKTYLFRKSLKKGYNSSPDPSVKFMIDQLEFIETHSELFFKKNYYELTDTQFKEKTLSYDIFIVHQRELDLIESGSFIVQ